MYHGLILCFLKHNTKIGKQMFRGEIHSRYDLHTALS